MPRNLPFEFDPNKGSEIDRKHKMGSLKVNVVVNKPESLIWNFSLELKVNSKKDVDIYNSNINPLAIFCELFKDKLEDQNNKNIQNVQEKEKSDNVISEEFIYHIIGIAMNSKENERSSDHNFDILAFKVKREKTLQINEDQRIIRNTYKNNQIDNLIDMENDDDDAISETSTSGYSTTSGEESGSNFPEINLSSSSKPVILDLQDHEKKQPQGWVSGFKCRRCQSFLELKQKAKNLHGICKNCVLNNKANQNYIQQEHDYCSSKDRKSPVSLLPVKLEENESLNNKKVSSSIEDVKSSPSVDQILCNICRKIFPTEKQLLVHMCCVHQPSIKLERITEFEKNFQKCTMAGCDFSTYTKDLLQKHQKSLHWACQTYNNCGEIFSTQELLIEHIKNDHQCGITGCDFSTTTHELLIQHQKTEHRDWICQAYNCGKIFNTEKLLMDHIKNDHQVKCDIAGCNVKNIKNKELLIQHQKTVHWPCKRHNCGKIFGTMELLMEHIKNNHQQPKEKCGMTGCDFLTTTQELLRNHHETEHWVCQRSNCGAVFCTYELLMEHIKSKHQVKCWITGCDFSTTTQELLIKHRKIEHRDWICQADNCGKIFTTENLMMEHIKNDHQVKCGIAGCDVKNMSKEVLIKHQKSVHKDRICSVYNCDEIFSTEGLLKEHIKNDHSKKKIPKLANSSLFVIKDNNWHKCKYCDKKFKSELLLRHHKLQCFEDIRISDDENIQKPSTEEQFKDKDIEKNDQSFECHWSYCNLHFDSIRLLNKHMEFMHHSYYINLRGCHYCEKRFESEVLLNQHKQQFHTNQDKKEKGTIINCPVNGCELSFNSQELLKRHIKYVHVYDVNELSTFVQQPMQYKCGKCKLVYKSMKEFRKHNENCQTYNARSNFCHPCAKMFESKLLLIQHKQQFHSDQDNKVIMDSRSLMSLKGIQNFIRQQDENLKKSEKNTKKKRKQQFEPSHESSNTINIIEKIPESMSSPNNTSKKQKIINENKSPELLEKKLKLEQNNESLTYENLDPLLLEEITIKEEELEICDTELSDSNQQGTIGIASMFELNPGPCC